SSRRALTRSRSMTTATPPRRRSTCSSGAGSNKAAQAGQSLREPLLIAAHVKVAKGDGTGVGDVVRFGKVVEAELGLDRVLDLQLGSAAIAGERFFDSRRGITEDRRVVLGRGQHDRTASVSHQDRCARVADVAVDSFDGDRTGRK